MHAVYNYPTFTEDSSKKHPFPCPCSYRTAFTYYVDLTGPVRTHLLKELSDFASDPEEKEKLKFMASRTDEGKVSVSPIFLSSDLCVMYASWEV